MGGLPSFKVSAAELRVLRLVLQGLTNDEIGARLGITEHTVKAHVSRLLRKFDAANRAELAARAVEFGAALPRKQEP